MIYFIYFVSAIGVPLGPQGQPQPVMGGDNIGMMPPHASQIPPHGQSVPMTVPHVMPPPPPPPTSSQPPQSQSKNHRNI